MVVGSYVICPAEPRDPSDRECTVEDYRRRSDFGVCVLKPGACLGRLKKLLVRHLADGAQFSNTYQLGLRADPLI